MVNSQITTSVFQQQTNKEEISNIFDFFNISQFIKDNNEITKNICNYLENLKQIINSNPFIINEMYNNLSHYLNIFKIAFDRLVIPTIIWERYGVIHYVNNSFKFITKFCTKLPTLSNKIAFLEQLSLSSVENFVSLIKKIFLNKNEHSIIFNCEILKDQNNNDIQKNFISGIMCITIKRDTFGLPFVFIGNFIPTQNK
jgi:hypothetical protein